jgi:alpha-glucosidase (family GH31 glycosyl hydrolase)
MSPRAFSFVITFAVALGACSDDSSNNTNNTTPVEDAGPDDSGSPSDSGQTNANNGADAGDVDMAADPCDVPDAPPIQDPEIYTPRWAFEPWISKDISDRDDTYDFVDGFIARDIPVGVVVLDSPWETHYNTFIPNPDRYPDFEQMVDDMGERDVKVVLWITQMVNRVGLDAEIGGDTYEGPSPNYVEGKACGFLVNEGDDYFWWKGFGAGVDFFNPKARTWWHAQQDALLEMGVAGWKLDFGEQYLPLSGVDTFEGRKTLQEYSEEYYRDFYAYCAQKVGTENCVTMVRAWDESYQWEGRFYARPEHAPVAWMGDNTRDWRGLIDALDHMFISALAGYVVLGSDIGGYLDRDDQDLGIEIPFDQNNFVRWTAVGAMTPFMQLHGRGNLTPWTVDERVEETVAAYRYWSKLHHQMIPFWYSTAQQSYVDGAEVPIRPVGTTRAEWEDDWRYEIGDAFLVAPLLTDAGEREVELPAGSTWYDWWEPAAPIEPGTISWEDGGAQLRIPLYVKEGAIVPLDDVDDSTGISPAGREAWDTILMWHGAAQTNFKRYDADGATTEISLIPNGDGARVSMSRVPRTTQLRVLTAEAITSVTVGGNALAMVSETEFATVDSGYYTDGTFTWVKLAESTDAVEVVLTP